MKVAMRAFLVSALAILAINSSSGTEPKATDTTVNESSFRLKLPGVWKSGKTDDPNKRTYYTTEEQLTVSIFGPLFGPGTMNHQDKAERFKKWVSKRRDIETRLPDFKDVVVNDPSFAEINGTMGARYWGFDKKRNRRFHCLILASNSAFEIFYYEAVNLTAAAVESRAKAIFNSVNIPE